MSQLFAWGGQSTGVSALASFLPKKSQGWSLLGRQDRELWTIMETSHKYVPSDIHTFFPLKWQNVHWLLYLQQSKWFLELKKKKTLPVLKKKKKNEIPGLISFRMDWLDLLVVQGTLKNLLQHHSSKASILQHPAFFTVQLSHPYMTTGKTIALTGWTFVGKVMSLLLNMLSRLVITFLLRSKCLLISWLQSSSAVILEPRKIKSDTVSWSQCKERQEAHRLDPGKQPRLQRTS